MGNTSLERKIGALEEKFDKMTEENNTRFEALTIKMQSVVAYLQKSETAAA